MGKNSPNRKSNIFRLGIFIILVFLCESFVMASMSSLFQLPLWGEILLDSCFLLILLFPGFYFFIYRPMKNQIQERGRLLDALREQEKRYRLMMEAMHDPVYICSGDYRIIYMNPAMIRRTGRDATGNLCYKEIHDQERICPWCVNDKIQRGEYAEYEAVSPVDGRFYNVAQCPIFYLDGRIDKMVILRDLTGYKRAEEALQWELDTNKTLAALSKALLSSRSVEEISSLILESAKHFTGSAFGYVGFIEERSGYLISPTLTQEVWDACTMEDKKATFKDFTGLWGWVLKNKRSLISNRVDEDPRSSGVPEGHIPIRQFLSSPALIGEKLVGQIALSNPERDYDDRDLKLIENLADIYALTIHKFRTEARLRRARDELERRVDERTAKLKETNLMLSKKITDHKTAEEALQRSEEQLRRLGRKLLTSQEEERRLIAIELHDGIGQIVSAIKFKVETVVEELKGKESAQAFQSLGPVVSMIQDAVEEVRRISKNLRPPTLDDLGIVATISWFCREFMKIYSDIQVEKEIFLNEEEVPHELKISIFRMLQEAFNNVAKHSQADVVRVVLRKRDGCIDLKIEDNGRGFDIKTALGQRDPDAGLGLASMKERATLSGGSFEVESSPGKGVRIAVSLPSLAKGQRSTSPLSIA